MMQTLWIDDRSIALAAATQRNLLIVVGPNNARRDINRPRHGHLSAFER